MWGIPLLSRLRQSSLSKREVLTERSSERHSGPMSDRQLAVAIREFRRFLASPNGLLKRARHGRYPDDENGK